jgi:hypothetical protein
MPMASSGRFQVRLGTWRGPGLACRGRSACWADGAALVQGGSSPDAVLPGRQPVGQAGVAHGAALADCLGGADLGQAGVARDDRGEQLGIRALTGFLSHPAEKPDACLCGSITSSSKSRQHSKSAAGRRDVRGSASARPVTIPAMTPITAPGGQ